MNGLIILLCLVAMARADVRDLTATNIDLFKYNPNDVYTLPEDIDDEKPAVIFLGDIMKAKVEKLESLNGRGKFKLDLKTQNGIEVSSVGKLKDGKTFVVSGSYAFTGVDGKRYRTRYTADEFGYHPMTELDLDIPEPQPLDSTKTGFNLNQNRLNVGSNRNRFQFLNQNLNTDNNRRGSGQSGDDYSYNLQNSGTEFDDDSSYSNGGNFADPNAYSNQNYYPSESSYSDANANGNNLNTNGANRDGYGTSGDNYGDSYSAQNTAIDSRIESLGDGYDYTPPELPYVPSRQYLPVL